MADFDPPILAIFTILLLLRSPVFCHFIFTPVGVGGLRVAPPGVFGEDPVVLVVLVVFLVVGVVAVSNIKNRLRQHCIGD